MSVEQPANIVFDDLEAALDALEVGVDFVEQSRSNVQRLRWAIIAIHQATQGFMIRALKGSDGTGVLTEKGSTNNALWYPPQSEEQTQALVSRGVNALNDLASVYGIES